MPEQSSKRQPSRLVVGIAGRIGAGKTSVGKYLESRYGFFYIRYSQVLSDWKARDPESRAHLQEVGWEVMEGGEQVELNRRLVARIEAQSRCAVDGLRHPLDEETLSQAFSPDFYLLYIHSPEEIRWRRLHEHRPDRYPDLETFRAVDTYPVEQHIDLFRGHADAILENNASLQALYANVDAVLEKLQQGDQA
ncbi:MAG: AAA family ATPase [Acidobacteriia bacterium]|nr:AAA family ATPase [Terriglobia bacterium]